MARRSNPVPAPQKADPNELLTLKEICAKLKISRSTFYDWRQKGKGPKVSLRLPNGDLRFRRGDFDAWLDACQEEVA